jgi:dCMP deaminase
MLIGISGPIHSGKSTVADYLVTTHGFTHLYLQDKKSSALASNADAVGRDDVFFETVAALRDYVTKHWQMHFVLTQIPDLAMLELLQQRPFFLHVTVDAPVSVRYQRYKKTTSITDFAEFVAHSDAQLFSPDYLAVTSRAALRVVNAAQSLPELHAKLAALTLLDPDRLRPSWDAYFMRLANLASLRANCMKRQVGCVVVRDKRVIATGYNGTPRGLTNCNAGGCARCNDTGGLLETCLCLHAEENALLEAGRDRIRGGCVLYCNTCPCLTCSVKIVQVGVAEVVYLNPYSMDDASRKVLEDGGVKLRQFVPPREGLVV